MKQRTTVFSDFMKEYENSEQVFLGPYSYQQIVRDPKHFLFTLARYKFCSKMLAGKEDILEVGCGEAHFGADIILQVCNKLTGIDIFSDIINYNIVNNRYPDRADYLVHDITEREMQKKYDAAYSLDVIEHIQKESEGDFLLNIARSLKQQGVCIVGIPNITASAYASETAKNGHINLKDHKELQELLLCYFYNVFIFSMNDEVVHTGFYPMAHYLLALAVNPRNEIM